MRELSSNLLLYYFKLYKTIQFFKFKNKKNIFLPLFLINFSIQEHVKPFNAPHGFRENRMTDNAQKENEQIMYYSPRLDTYEQ